MRGSGSTHRLIPSLTRANAKVGLPHPCTEHRLANLALDRIAKPLRKTALGKYSLGVPLNRLEGAIDAAGFLSLDITMRHAMALESVQTPHTDPFDRPLLAQCEVETLRLLTTDKVLLRMPAALSC